MARFSIVLLLLSLSASPGTAHAPQEADFYVSPRGNDSWSGTHAAPRENRMDGPFATIVRAQTAVRALQAARPNRSRPIVVAVRGGTYFLTKPLIFAPEDSGTLHAPVVYRAYRGEHPVISGGRPIKNWTVNENGHWQAELRSVEIGTWDFSQLFVDGQRRFRPRVPRTGYHRIAGAVPPTPAADSLGGDDRFQYTRGAINASWENRDQLEVVAFHSWSASRLRIESLNTNQRTVTFTGPTWTQESYGRLKTGNRFIVTNVREALNEPGEWYLNDSSGQLTYIPREGESPDHTQVVSPWLQELVRFEGDIERREWVEHIHFRGLTFAHTNWQLPPRGQSFPQAEIGLSGAINVIGGRHLVVDSCVVRNTGGYGISFGRGSKYNTVENSALIDLGGGGIKIGHAGRDSWEEVGEEPGNPAATASHHTIQNNTIAHGGRLHPAGVGVWIGPSPYNSIEHNEIFDFYYTGISVGWSWGYQPNPAHHNEIVYNHIHTIGQNVLSDMAGVYTLGVSPGTRVSHNHIHEVQSFDYGGWGLYTDEGSSYITMRSNLVHDTKTGGFHQHYGKDNLITNNIFAFSANDQIQRTRAEDHHSFTFTHNIVYYDQGQLLGGNWQGDNFTLDHNLYWRADGETIRFPDDLSFERWQAERNQDLQSVIANPRFVEPEERNFHFRPDSPADKIGFEPFDFTEAGRTDVRVLTRDLPEVPDGF